MDLRSLIEESHPLKNGLRLCPFHSEETPSFNVHRTGGYYKCFGCGASGDAVTWLREMRGMDFKEAKELAISRGLYKGRDDAPQRSAPRPAAREGLSATAKWGLRLWDEAVPITDTPVEWYLRARSIECDFETIRYHPSVPKDGGESYPSMLVLVTDRDGNRTGIQATFLARVKHKDGTLGAWIKAHGKDSRRTLGTIAGMNASVKFGKPMGGVIAVAEGVETAISGSLLGLMPAEAVLGIGNLAEWTPPEGVKKIILCGEGDQEEKWRAASDPLTEAGYEVRLYLGKGKLDANDALKLSVKNSLPPAIHEMLDSNY